MNSRTIWEQFGADFAVLRIAFNKGFSFKGFVVHQYRIQDRSVCPGAALEWKQQVNSKNFEKDV